MDRQTWIAACAHRLQLQWRTVDPGQLEEVAADLWGDERLRDLEPVQAAGEWLRPINSVPGRPAAKEPQRA
ncbi:MAG: hypothetical protein DI587_03315 [Variovorax paradoxus]|nr:MAG: hypothetical protein DI583_03315 [Variovorax paradoxus]PZQ15746.1 MAG: hypothetical protein DI587_03315 [Variovorax paradoxus]